MCFKEMRNDFGTIRFGYVYGPVGTSRIHNKNIRDPSSDALQAFLNIHFLVVSQHKDGQRNLCHYSLPCTGVSISH